MWWYGLGVANSGVLPASVVENTTDPSSRARAVTPAMSTVNRHTGADAGRPDTLHNEAAHTDREHR